MKFTIQSYNAVAIWKWDTSTEPHKLHHYAGEDDEDEDDDDVCGICRLAYESTCPECKVPGDDCPLIWGECTHIFHMHCLLKWIETESSKGQCPMDRRPWVTADRKPDQLPTTTTGEPVIGLAPGPLPVIVHAEEVEEEEEEEGEANVSGVLSEGQPVFLEHQEEEGDGEGDGEGMEVDNV